MSPPIQKFCAACGSKTDQNDKFCYECGTKLVYKEIGYKLIGYGFLAAIIFSLGMYGILILKRGIFLSSNYAMFFGFIYAGVVFGTIIALYYATEDEQVAGCTYFVLIMIFGIIGIALTIV